MQINFRWSRAASAAAVLLGPGMVRTALAQLSPTSQSAPSTAPSITTYLDGLKVDELLAQNKLHHWLFLLFSIGMAVNGLRSRRSFPPWRRLPPWPFLRWA